MVGGNTAYGGGSKPWRKNLNTGIYVRGDPSRFTNLICADNMVSLFIAYNQRFENSLLIGENSMYPSDFERAYLNRNSLLLVFM
jgi:hypothetical protein